MPVTVVDSQKPVALVFGSGGIKSRVMSEPNRLTTRAVAEVPDLCMPATIMPAFEGDLRPAATRSCMNYPHAMPPWSQMCGRRTTEHLNTTGASCVPSEVRRVDAATNQWCLLSPEEDRTPDENQSYRAESKLMR